MKIMRRIRARVAGVAGVVLLGALLSQTAQATAIPIGYLSFDQVTGTTAAFDIINITGSNEIGFDPTFPVTTPVTLSSLNLVVDFTDGSSLTFSSGDFGLSLDGLSLDGPTVAIGGTVLPVSAVLTGDLSPTALTLYDASSITVDSSLLPTSLTDATGGALQDGDYAIVNASTSTGGPTVPEPGTLMLMLGALPAFWMVRRTNRMRSRSALGRARILTLAGVAALLPWTSSWAIVPVTTVNLAIATAPSTGVAGVSSVNLTTRGLPGSTTPAQVHVAVAPTCAAGGSVSGEVDTTAASIRSLPGTMKRVQLLLPSGLTQGTYFVSISGTATDGTQFASSTCSIVSVTTSNATLNACLPTSSLAVALGPTVTAYVPNGWWSGGTSGVQAVPIEGGGVPTAIATPSPVNSCSSNPATGQTVCTANSTDVYLVSGTTLTNTLTSGATGSAGFSGGSCQNCGVAINALTNSAYIEVGLSSGPSSSGVQALNLSNNSFAVPFPTTHVVSENISVDPGRGLILTPGESNYYDLLQLNAGGSIVGEFTNGTIGGGGEYDSAAEDCTTGVALAANEFSSNVSLADLNQASFTAGSPGTWSAPSAVDALAGSFAAGTSGISVAPGSSHLGIVTGEFGGQSFAVLQLPATPGTGGATPAIVDYAYVDSLPNTPDNVSFSAGFDPHTITAYASPNDGRAYGVIADWAVGTPSYLAVLDLQKLLAAPRISGTHTVDQSAFDLLGSGALRYVATH